MAAKDILEVVQSLKATLMKLSDGTVDPGDVEFVDEQIARLNEFLSQGLSNLVEDQQENLALGVLVLGTIEGYLFFKAMRE